MVDVPECQACSACCFSELSRYVRVTGDDYERLGEAAEALVHFDGTRAYMRMVDGHCVALELDGKTGQFACGAYATRPQVCRDLARGSRECAGERFAKGERPLAMLRAKR